MLRKNIQNFLEKTNFNENHKDDSDIEKSPFSTHFFVLCHIIVSDIGMQGSGSQK
jgi:hypothetical protein